MGQFCVPVNLIRRLAALASSGERSAMAAAWVLLALGGGIMWLIVLRPFWPVLDVLSPLGPHAFAGAAVAAIALMLTRGRTFFLMSSLGAILLAPSLLSLDALERRGERRLPWHDAILSQRDPLPQLRVLAINTWHANGNLGELRSYIHGADADVVVLSEFGPNKQAMLGSLKAAYPYQASCAASWACSQVLLSRVPFVRSGTRMPTPRTPPMVWAEFRVGAVDAAKLTVIGTHVFRPTRRHDLHKAQLVGLANIVRKTEGSVILAGDFNMTRMSQSFDDFSYASGLMAPPRLLASWPAWPIPLPQFQLDYVFVSQDLQVLDQRLGHMIGSDHLPLWSAVRLPERGSVIAERPQQQQTTSKIAGNVLR